MTMVHSRSPCSFSTRERVTQGGGRGMGLSASASEVYRRSCIFGRMRATRDLCRLKATSDSAALLALSRSRHHADRRCARCYEIVRAPRHKDRRRPLR